jgi:hypothetical protein
MQHVLLSVQRNHIVDIINRLPPKRNGRLSKMVHIMQVHIVESYLKLQHRCPASTLRLNAQR